MLFQISVLGNLWDQKSLDLYQFVNPSEVAPANCLHHPQWNCQIKQDYFEHSGLFPGYFTAFKIPSYSEPLIWVCGSIFAWADSGSFWFAATFISLMHRVSWYCWRCLWPLSSRASCHQYFSWAPLPVLSYSCY